ncbi:hypothetical protein T10_8564 [Trichinella papuae]|uniref:Uncharacterized protein n=1 Tax=Trichinella papuae TaxID=268474 RepID=A0A0V1MBW6_9BILA|nr:hypothetical protein T10_8564 [Trichinella papuae]
MENQQVISCPQLQLSAKTRSVMRLPYYLFIHTVVHVEFLVNSVLNVKVSIMNYFTASTKFHFYKVKN